MARPYRPALHKRLMNRAWVRIIITFLLSLYLRALWLTARVEWRIAPEAEPYVTGEKQSLYCFWHGRLLFMPYFANPKRRPMYVLTSRHRDGLLIAETVSWLGVKKILGSSSKGAHDALRTMLRTAKAGHNLAISPDGPRGPYQIAAPGTVWVAKASGVPILPLTYSSSRRRHLKSWDRFLLPRFFSRVVMHAAAPVFIPPDTDNDTLESHRAALETFMQRQTNDLDAELS